LGSTGKNILKKDFLKIKSYFFSMVFSKIVLEKILFQTLEKTKVPFFSICTVGAGGKMVNGSKTQDTEKSLFELKFVG
jgi:hypothetical protein